MYNLPPHIDQNKMFLVKRSQPEGRIDSEFYKENFDFSGSIKLKSISKVKGGKRIPRGYNYSEIETDYIYLRVSDLDSDRGINWDSVKYIPKEIFDILERYEIIEGDLVFSIAGSIGKINLIKNIPIGRRVILTENASKIHFKNQTPVLPEFVELVLKLPLIQKQIDLNYIQTTIPKIGLDRIENLYIPKLKKLSTQQKIVDIYNHAYSEQQEKQGEAKRLLASIDPYLLGQLGITLPKRDHTLSSRMFTVQWSEVSGDRFDVFSFQNNAIKVEGGVYPNKRLRELVTTNKGQSITSNNIIDGDYPLIAGGKSSPYFHNEYNYTGKTITISASGAYSGYVWYHNAKIFASDCTVIKSKDRNIITIEYLFEILKLKQTEIYGLQQGAGQPHVYSSDLVKLKIPLPPLEKQEAIAMLPSLRWQ